MALCIHRPQRTYDAQYIIEFNDARGLVKMLGEQAGCSDFHAGAWLALGTLFELSEQTGRLDTWEDFMEAFDKAIENYTKGGE